MVETAPAVPAGQIAPVSPSSEGLGGLAARAGEIKAARAAGSSSKRGAYRKHLPGCLGRHGEGPCPGQAAAPAAPAQPLFTPENTADLCKMPFALAALGTGCESLELDEAESKRLAIPGAVVLNEWIAVQPKYVALGLFSLALVSVSAKKAILYAAWKQERLMAAQEAAAKAEAARRAGRPLQPITPPAPDSGPTLPPVLQTVRH